jgi:hypothetical protein
VAVSAYRLSPGLSLASLGTGSRPGQAGRTIRGDHYLVDEYPYLIDDPVFSIRGCPKRATEHLFDRHALACHRDM